MKLRAQVKRVLKSGIHYIGTIGEGGPVPVQEMPIPDSVIIEINDNNGIFMMFRYTKSGEFCGDTWHENLELAFQEAEYEYGLLKEDFMEFNEDCSLD